MEDYYIAACYHGKTSKIARYLRKGILPDAYENQGLITACYNNNTEVAKLLLQSGASPNATVPRDRLTYENIPLYVAAREGHLEMVELLLTYGVDIHAFMDIAIRIACEKRHIPVIKCLLQNGADPNVLDGQAIRFAIQGNYTNVVEILLTHPGIDVNVHPYGLSSAAELLA